MALPIAQDLEEVENPFKIQIDFLRNSVTVQERNADRQCFFVREVDPRLGIEEKMTFDGVEVPMESRTPNVYDTYWPKGQNIEGVKKIAEHFLKTTKLEVLDQIFIAEHNPVMEILKWFDSLGVKMNHFNLAGAPKDQVNEVSNFVYSDGFMEKVLINFTSLLETSPGFKPSKLEKVKMGKFSSMFSSWFNGAHWMGMNCGSLILYESELREEDINKFLDSWNKGEDDDFLYLSVHMKNGFTLDLQKISNGLVDEKDIDRTSDGNQSITFTRPSDGKEIELELNENGKHFVAYAG